MLGHSDKQISRTRSKQPSRTHKADSKCSQLRRLCRPNACCNGDAAFAPHAAERHRWAGESEASARSPKFLLKAIPLPFATLREGERLRAATPGLCSRTGAAGLTA